MNQTSPSMSHLEVRELSPMQLQNMLIAEQQEKLVSEQALQVEKCRTKQLLNLIKADV